MEALAQVVTYEGPGGLVIHIEQPALAHLYRNAQHKCWSREAGGQLFASIKHNRWVVTKATGPRTTDFRSRFGFRPDRKAERAEILALFQEGLHYVGDWHTHPQNVPSPSHTDIRNITETVQASEHSLSGFLLAIVGRLPAPDGLWLSFHDVRGGYAKCPLRCNLSSEN
ncbi:Mov34/MPN/PAD-1 family protein [Sphingobium aromaticiconvertens]|uniref:Mov34/MPN/PAD-1 family protein n=1 Tax=Sphingobium aromaticiconvertens TaxID=365341 RepID=UPI003017BF67